MAAHIHISIFPYLYIPIHVDLCMFDLFIGETDSLALNFNFSFCWFEI